MPELLPLQFEPVLREYLWGGRRLATLGKSLGAGDQYAESWEIVDHGSDQSIVAGGPLAGTSLHEIVVQHGTALFGRHHPQPQFPLLFKFLDCQRTLSVQVHPNDAQAAKLDPPDLGKTEAWVVLAAEPGSRIYAGLQPGIDRAAAERAIAAEDIEACLHHFEPQVGDCLLIEAGTVHALGAGLLVAEIQQASDTTFRLFDWNRRDSNGQPRSLHIAEALATIEYSRGPARPQQPQPTDRPHVQRLVSCDKFVLDRWQLDDVRPLSGNDRFHIVAIIEGRVTLHSNESGRAAAFDLRRGDTILLPACCRDVKLEPQKDAVLLDMYLP